MSDIFDDDKAWIAISRTENPVLRLLGNFAGEIGGRLLDFSLKYGDSYELDYDYLYGGDTITTAEDRDFNEWFESATQEIFDNIDLEENKES